MIKFLRVYACFFAFYAHVAIVGVAAAHHTTINNYITEVTEVTEVYDNSTVTNITEGVSEADLASALSIAASAGGHQFDYSTTDWQGSIVGAWYEDENAVSFGVAKKFKQDFLPNVLLHGNYTQDGSNDLWVIGGTFRF